MKIWTKKTSWAVKLGAPVLGIFLLSTPSLAVVPAVWGALAVAAATGITVCVMACPTPGKSEPVRVSGGSAGGSGSIMAAVSSGDLQEWTPDDVRDWERARNGAARLPRARGPVIDGTNAGGDDAGTGQAGRTQRASGLSGMGANESEIRAAEARRAASLERDLAEAQGALSQNLTQGVAQNQARLAAAQSRPAAEAEAERKAILAEPVQPPERFREIYDRTGIKTNGDLLEKGNQYAQRLDESVQKRLAEAEKLEQMAAQGERAARKFASNEKSLQEKTQRFSSLTSEPAPPPKQAPEAGEKLTEADPSGKPNPSKEPAGFEKKKEALSGVSEELAVGKLLGKANISKKDPSDKKESEAEDASSDEKDKPSEKEAALIEMAKMTLEKLQEEVQGRSDSLASLREGSQGTYSAPGGESRRLSRSSASSAGTHPEESVKVHNPGSPEKTADIDLFHRIRYRITAIQKEQCLSSGLSGCKNARNQTENI